MPLQVHVFVAAVVQAEIRFGRTHLLHVSNRRRVSRKYRAGWPERSTGGGGRQKSRVNSADPQGDTNIDVDIDLHTASDSKEVRALRDPAPPRPATRHTSISVYRGKALPGERGRHVQWAARGRRSARTVRSLAKLGAGGRGRLGSIARAGKSSVQWGRAMPRRAGQASGLNASRPDPITL